MDKATGKHLRKQVADNLADWLGGFAYSKKEEVPNGFFVYRNEKHGGVLLTVTLIVDKYDPKFTFELGFSTDGQLRNLDLDNLTPPDTLPASGAYRISHMLGHNQDPWYGEVEEDFEAMLKRMDRDEPDPVLSPEEFDDEIGRALEELRAVGTPLFERVLSTFAK